MCLMFPLYVVVLHYFSALNMFNGNANINIVPFLCLTFEHNADSDT